MYDEKTNQVTNWTAYIKKCNEVGASSPTPYKVIPYKNGIGIRRMIFLSTGKAHCPPFHNTNDQKDCHDPSLIKKS